LLYIAAPYGSPCGLSVSLVAPNERYFEVGEVVIDFGCPPHIADRVRSCIKASGRYDCFVSNGVAKQFNLLQFFMVELGGNAIVRATDSYEYKFGYLKRDSITETVGLDIQVKDSNRHARRRLKKFEAVVNVPVASIGDLIEEVLREVTEKQERIFKETLLIKDIIMKTFIPQSHDNNLSAWLSNENNATPLTGKEEVTQTIQSGDKYPGFLKDNKIVVATTEGEGRQLVSEAKADTSFYAIDRSLVDNDAS
jgi:hypothetical protein